MWKIFEALKEANCKTQKTVVPEIKNAIYGMKYSLERIRTETFTYNSLQLWGKEIMNEQLIEFFFFF